MKSKDPELSRMEYERKLVERKVLIESRGRHLSRVPESVLVGSVQVAVAWKADAAKAQRLMKQTAPKLEALREVNSKLLSY